MLFQCGIGNITNQVLQWNLVCGNLTAMQIPKLFARCFHSLGLAVLPVLGMYANDVDKFIFSEIFLPMFTYLAFVIASLAVLTLLTRDLERSSLAVSIMFFALVFYAPVASGIVGEVVYGWTAPNCLFAALWLAFWIAEAYVISFKFKYPKVLRVFGNAFMAVLLFLIMSQAARYNFVMKPGADLKVVNDDIVAFENKPEELPDIYYIVLDSYPSDSVLKELYDFDNSEFTSFLKSKGFFIADNSHANYPLTYFSLASSLNMGYLALGPGHQKSFHGFSPLVDLILDNKATQDLKKLGYRTVSFASGYLATEMRNFDICHSENLMCREFFNALAKQTILISCEVAGWKLARFMADAHRRNIIWSLSEFPSVVNFSEPAFVFAHVLAPHAPFVFRKDGSAREIDYFDYSDGIYIRKHMDLATYRQQFLEQLICINGLVKECINKMLDSGSRRKVIIIQGDHGPASDVDYTSLERSNTRERMSILNAIYLPDGNYDGLKPTLSPVNNFRVVFNKAFKQQLNLLEDKCYYITFDNLYEFSDITSLVPQK